MGKVKDVMKRDVITVTRSTNLRELLQKFKDFHTFPLVPVVEEKKLVGVVKLENICKVFQPKEPEILKTLHFIDERPVNIFEVDMPPEMGYLVLVEDIMDTRFITVEEEDNLNDALSKMRLNNLIQVPVIDKNKNLVGIIGVFDIIKNLFMERGII